MDFDSGFEDMYYNLVILEIFSPLNCFTFLYYN